MDPQTHIKDKVIKYVEENKPENLSEFGVEKDFVREGETQIC